MTTILGLSGSLRRASFNSGLLRAAAELAPAGTTIRQGSIREVPLYDAVQTLQAQLRDADGLLMVTPEYNNGMPGVFKNAIDWMSRGEGLGFFRGKPVAVLGASPGGFGTLLAQNGWLPVLRTLGTRPWFEGRMLVSRAGGLFDDQGNLTDDRTRAALADFIAGFGDAIRAG
ncbi:MAG TPA: NADPH-dependent FMN reductase [Paracoccus sp. (in: a-proteobacteria)]|nr:NADPH-dependent FMN reductase [Paracoccus sp. (in: a-proteobacteria)]